MKKLIALVSALALTLSLAGCSSGKAPVSSGGSPAPGEEPYTLTVWYWGEQEAPGYKDYMEEMVRRYGERYPNITIDAVLQESDTMYSAFRTAESAGEGPDVQYLWGGTQALEDAWLGNLAPISDYITPEQLSDIPASTLSETNWDGKQWGIPAYQFAYGIAYNKELMAKAGIDPEKPYTTWEEFLDCCEKLKQAGVTPLGMGLKDGWLPAWLGIFLAQQNLDSVNEMIDSMCGDVSLTDPKYSEWLYKLEELKNKGYINNDILSLDLYQGQQLLENGQAAMTLHAQAYAVSLENSMGANIIGFAPAPVYGTGKLANSVAAPSQVYAIPKSAKHKEGAAQFLLFLQEEDNMKCLYEMANTLMPNKNFKSEWLTSEVDKTVMSWLDEYPNFCYQLYLAPMFEPEGLVPTVQKIFSEGLSPADAAAELDKALAKTSEQNPEPHNAFLKWSIAD